MARRHCFSLILLSMGGGGGRSGAMKPALGREVRGFARLRLLDDNSRLAVVGEILGRDFQIGIAGALDPIIEEALQVAAGGLFHGAAEIAGLRALELVLPGLSLNAFPRSIVPQLVP